MKTSIKNFFASRIGQYFSLILFAFGLWLANFRNWEICFISVVAMTYFRKHSRAILIIAGIYFWIFSENLNWEIVHWVGVHLQLPRFQSEHLFRVSILVAILVFCLSYVQLVLSSKWVRLSPLGLLIALFLLLFIYLLELPEPTIQQFWLWGFLIILSKFFWFLGYAVHDATLKGKSLKLKDALTFYPFWNNQTVPVPNGTRPLFASEARNPQALANSQWKGLKLLYWCLILKALNSVLDATTFGRQSYISRLLDLPSFYLPDPVVNGIAVLTESPTSFFMAWAVVYSKSLSYLLSFTFDYGVIVAIARMAGFSIFRNTYRPFEAKSFPAFWRRTMYYYSQIVITLFILPCQNKLQFIRHSGLRFFIACWLGIFTAAASFHFIRDSMFFGHLETGNAAYMYFSQIPFYFCVSFLVSIFLTFGRQYNIWKFIPAGRIVRPFIYLTLAGVLWSLIFDFRYNGGSWETYKKFLLILMGLGHSHV